MKYTEERQGRNVNSPAKMSGSSLQDAQADERLSIEWDSRNRLQLFVQAWHETSLCPISHSRSAVHTFATMLGQSQEEHTVSATRSAFDSPCSPSTSETVFLDKVAISFESKLRLSTPLACPDAESGNRIAQVRLFNRQQRDQVSETVKVQPIRQFVKEFLPGFVIFRAHTEHMIFIL